LHKVKLDEGDHNVEDWGMLEHSKYPKSESWTAKSESVPHAEGQTKALSSNPSYTRHNGEDWLEVKLEVNHGWHAEMTQIDSNNHQVGLIINSTEISA